MSKDFFDTLGSGFNKAKNFWDECKAQDDYLAAMRLENLRQEAIANTRQQNAGNYKTFANAL